MDTKRIAQIHEVRCQRVHALQVVIVALGEHDIPDPTDVGCAHLYWPDAPAAILLEMPSADLAQIFRHPADVIVRFGIAKKTIAEVQINDAAEMRKACAAFASKVAAAYAKKERT